MHPDDRKFLVACFMWGFIIATAVIFVIQGIPRPSV